MILVSWSVELFNRMQAVSLVDSYRVPDFLLNSALGKSDGTSLTPT
jgi:hypothetical protein